MRGNGERYLIFVVVALVVGTEAHEERKVVVGKLRWVELRRFGVYV